MTKEEIKLLGECRDLEVKCSLLVNELQKVKSIDQRSVSISKTKLQEAFMWIDQGIRQPETFFKDEY